MTKYTEGPPARLVVSHATDDANRGRFALLDESTERKVVLMNATPREAAELVRRYNLAPELLAALDGLVAAENVRVYGSSHARQSAIAAAVLIAEQVLARAKGGA